MAQEYHYWMSTDDVPFDTITTLHEYTENHYPIVVEAPDPSLKSPKYDWFDTHKWIENEAESQGERITKVEAQVKTLDQTANKLQNTATTLATTQQAATQQSQLVAKQVMASQKMMMNMQGMIASIAKQVGAPETPVAPANETETNETAKDNGGKE